MNILDRVAQHNEYKNWEDMVNRVKKRKINFTIPNYLNYNRHTISHTIILEALRAAEFNVAIQDDKIYLTKNKSEK